MRVSSLSLYPKFLEYASIKCSLQLPTLIQSLTPNLTLFPDLKCSKAERQAR